MEHLVVGTGQPTRADQIAVEQLRDTIVICRQLDDLGMSAAVLRASWRALARVEELLGDCMSPGARRPLTLIAGELCQLAGYAAMACMTRAPRGRMRCGRSRLQTRWAAWSCTPTP
jgi:hypothetical protein